MEFGESTKVQMTKALMPQHAECGASESVNGEALLNDGRGGIEEFRKRHRTEIGGARRWKIDRRRRDDSGKRVDNETMRSARQGGDLSIRCRNEEGIRESQATAKTGRLQTDADILRGLSGRAAWESNQANAILRTVHAVAITCELFGNGAVTDDNAGDGRSMVCADEDATWHETRHIHRIHKGKGRNAEGRKTQETDTIRMVRVATSIEEADLGVGPSKCSIREEE